MLKVAKNVSIIAFISVFGVTLFLIFLSLLSTQLTKSDRTNLSNAIAQTPFSPVKVQLLSIQETLLASIPKPIDEPNKPKSEFETLQLKLAEVATAIINPQPAQDGQTNEPQQTTSDQGSGVTQAPQNNGNNPSPSPTPTPNPTPTPTPTPSPTPAPSTAYKNGNFTSNLNYSVPDGFTESMTLNITINNDIITSVSTTNSKSNGESKKWQLRFEGAVSGVVANKSMDSYAGAKIGGATLTTGAFKNALASIKSQARN
jgi:uncharacterized protein with FMN-binding domain